MSGALPINSGSSLNQAQQGPTSQTAQASQLAETGAQTGTAADKSENKGQPKDFPALFKSMMQVNPDDSTQAGMLMTPLMDTTLANKAKDKAESAASSDQDQDAAAIAGLPMFAAEAGKGLPQLAWSGYVGVANNGGATALAMQGDQDGVLNAQAVAGQDLPNAILKAQEQVAKTQLQQGTTAAATGTDFSELMGKENLPALHMEHKFLTDNLAAPQSQTLNPNALSNTHTAAINDLSALAATTAARGTDNPAQQISVAVQHPQWSQQVGDRVHWMIGQNLNQADIHLNPPELGALQVHIQMHGDQASVSFSSPHALVRDALDAAMPRLREMMHDAGLTLGDVNVSGQALAQHQPRDSGTQQGQAGRFAGSGHSDEPQPIIATSAIKHLSPNSMLDVYA